MCGHHGNRTALIYANRRSTNEYITLMKRNFDYDKMTEYHSSTLKIKQKDGKTMMNMRPACVGTIGTEGRAVNNTREKRPIYYRIFDSKAALKADFPRKSVGKGAKVLRDANGDLPTVDYLLNRAWGLKEADACTRVQPGLEGDQRVIVAYCAIKDDYFRQGGSRAFERGTFVGGRRVLDLE